MEILLHRLDVRPDRTLGVLMIDGQFVCHTLEDVVREVTGEPVSSWKIPGKTAIPRGTYPLRMSYSPKFKRILPLIDDVPGFEGIRIHSGNVPEDTEGCILVGLREYKGQLLNSREALAQLTLKLNGAALVGEKMTITIA